MLGTGEEIPGRVCELAAGADLALIAILKPLGGSLELPHADLAVRGDAWSAPYRPCSSDPYLNGHVVSGSVSFRCEAGAEIEALQLNCSQHLGSYSGGPVERHDKDAESALIGVLLEQYFDREVGDRASDVLFAATIREALRRFHYLGMSHLLNVLSGDESVPGEHSPVRVPGPCAAPGPPLKSHPRLSDRLLESRIADTDSRLKAIHGWAVSGVLSQEVAEALKLSVALRLVES